MEPGRCDAGSPHHRADHSGRCASDRVARRSGAADRAAGRRELRIVPDHRGCSTESCSTSARRPVRPGVVDEARDAPARAALYVARAWASAIPRPSSRRARWATASAGSATSPARRRACAPTCRGQPALGALAATAHAASSWCESSRPRPSPSRCAPSCRVTRPPPSGGRTRARHGGPGAAHRRTVLLLTNEAQASDLAWCDDGQAGGDSHRPNPAVAFQCHRPPARRSEPAINAIVRANGRGHLRTRSCCGGGGRAVVVSIAACVAEGELNRP